jgi:hypothetical protein
MLQPADLEESSLRQEDRTDSMEQSSHAQGLDRPSSLTNPPCLPAGYRSGIITAITVMLGFSLLFLRSWVFELPGEWTPWAVVAATMLVIAIVIELFALWRSLQPEDEILGEYRITLRWFLASTALLLLSLIVAAFSYAHVNL